MNIDKKFNPTEYENRAAIDALKAEEQIKFPYYDARAGLNILRTHFIVVAIPNGMGTQQEIAYFPVANDFKLARQMAESLARQINSQRS